MALLFFYESSCSAVIIKTLRIFMRRVFILEITCDSGCCSGSGYDSGSGSDSGSDSGSGSDCYFDSYSDS